jgi:hypothetical protein
LVPLITDDVSAARRCDVNQDASPVNPCIATYAAALGIARSQDAKSIAPISGLPGSALAGDAVGIVAGPGMAQESQSHSEAWASKAKCQGDWQIDGAQQCCLDETGADEQEWS